MYIYIHCFRHAVSLCFHGRCRAYIYVSIWFLWRRRQPRNLCPSPASQIRADGRCRIYIYIYIYIYIFFFFFFSCGGPESRCTSVPCTFLRFGPLAFFLIYYDLFILFLFFSCSSLSCCVLWSLPWPAHCRHGKPLLLLFLTLSARF